MADVLSPTLTGQEASPVDFADPRLSRSDLRVCSDRVDMSSASDGDVARLFRVYSSWVVQKITLHHDAFGTGAVGDVGLYQIDGGAVVDANLYGAAISMASAAQQVDVDTGVANYNGRGPIWEDIGLSADSDQWYDMCVTMTDNGTGGELVLQLFYSEIS